jgi:hypothetical protein
MELGNIVRFFSWDSILEISSNNDYIPHIEAEEGTANGAKRSENCSCISTYPSIIWSNLVIIAPYIFEIRYMMPGNLDKFDKSHFLLPADHSGFL